LNGVELLTGENEARR